MRLRNKITNKICDAEAREDGIYVKTNFGDGEKWHKYGLGCLGDNWEYYVEPKEPLIKDEKIRKAVRAWAEACFIETVEYDEYWVSFRRDDKTISFKDEGRCLGFYELENSGDYTIDELCGELQNDANMSL